ncbi:MAG TPA: response regulator [Blastocatellia bacterium]|nr:response regulator [Blastocatellia bacterium]
MQNILLVEDDEQLRAMLKRLLVKSGYQVWEAENGQGVADVYQQNEIDLVITDLLMPDKEGLEVIRDIRRQDPGARIIAMSGGGKGAAATYLLVAEKLGASYTLSKPFNNGKFLEAVRQALEMT